MNYRCVAASPEAYVKQIAASFLPHGYCFYVNGYVPERWADAPGELDRRLIAKFGVDLSKSARSRKKKDGVASVRYLRCGRTWILLSTHGDHLFFREHSVVHHVERRPIHFAGYAIRTVNGRVRVTIERGAYRSLTDELLSLSTQVRYRNEGALAATIRRKASFEPYAGVIEQHVRLIRRINRRRRSQGLSRLSLDGVRLRRRLGAGPRLLDAANQPREPASQAIDKPSSDPG
ncbi:MAG: hypothetical protein AAF662_04395 [Pseudomonadota bacterium]